MNRDLGARRTTPIILLETGHVVRAEEQTLPRTTIIDVTGNVACRYAVATKFAGRSR